MLTDTISPVVADIELENFRVSDEDLPEFCDLKFENINELHIDHPGANDAGYSDAATTSQVPPRAFARRAR